MRKSSWPLLLIYGILVSVATAQMMYPVRFSLSACYG